VPIAGLLGAFSIDNAGDALVGYATRRGLVRLRPDLDLRLFAPRLPQPVWRHEFSARRGLGVPVCEATGEWTAGLDALVVGGGGLLVPDPTFAPFWLGDPVTAAFAGPVAWNALGAQGPWLAPEAARFRDGLARACERLAYVSVRDRDSERLLRRCGYAGPVAVVPDPVLGLELDDDGTGDRLLREAGVDPARFVVGLSPGQAVADPACAAFFGEIVAVLGRVTDVAVLVFPFGHLYGDDRAAAPIARALPGAHLLARPLDPLELWHLVGRLGFYVCTRFHAVLAALAQDRPFVVLDEYRRAAEATSKIHALCRDTGLEDRYLGPYLAERPAPRLAANLGAARAGRTAFAPLLINLRARVERHLGEMATALLGPPAG
jgi:polysaccharide pyruvyl transferase WcaK-like protein